MTVPIVVLRPDDGDRLHDLDVLVSAHPTGATGWTNKLEQPPILALGIEGDGGKLQAMLIASLQFDDADIQDVAVDPACRRNGLATALIRALANRAGERGIARLTLDVSATNSGALALYAGLGFTEDGRRHAYYRDGTDAILMSRPVSTFTGLIPPLSPSRGHEPD